MYPWPSPRDDSGVSLKPLASPARIDTASLPRYLDVSLLMSWLSARQYAPEGGFAGRTNKLVDGCYSHWVGGCWPLLEASISGPQVQDELTKSANPGGLFSREGLIRYVLSCCQADEGGLRDKPET